MRPRRRQAPEDKGPRLASLSTWRTADWPAIWRTAWGGRRRGDVVTADRARKARVRERMAATGEPYARAARAVDAGVAAPIAFTERNELMGTSFFAEEFDRSRGMRVHAGTPKDYGDRIRAAADLDMSREADAAYVQVLVVTPGDVLPSGVSMSLDELAELRGQGDEHVRGKLVSILATVAENTSRNLMKAVGQMLGVAPDHPAMNQQAHRVGEVFTTTPPAPAALSAAGERAVAELAAGAAATPPASDGLA